MNSKTYIIILNWNGYTDTVACIHSLYQHVPRDTFRIVVVDNGSFDQEGSRLAEQFPDIHCIQNSRNNGFCLANNQGIRYCVNQDDCGYIMLLNNDTQAVNDFLTPLRAACHDQRQAVSPVVCHADRPAVIQQAGGMLRFGATVHHLRNKPYNQQRGDQSPDCLVGTGILAPTSVWQSVGWLDERFFAYFEDVDWSLRARQRGVALRVVAQSRVLHHHSRSTRGSYLKSYYLARNRNILFAKHYLGWSRRWRVCVGATLQWVRDCVQYHSFLFVPSFVRGLREGVTIARRDILVQSFPCVVCGNHTHRLRYREQDRLFGFGGTFSYYRCQTCRVLTQYPMLSEERLSRYYPETYNPHRQHVYSWRERLEERAYRWQHASGWRRTLSQALQYVVRRGCIWRVGGRLLDVGSGSGVFLSIIQRLGMTGVGVDYYAPPPDQQSNQRWYQQPLSSFDIPEDPFDVITLNHVLEHVHDPRSLLTRLHTHCRDDGTLIVQVPNAASLSARIFTCYHPALDAPRHLHAFSIRNLTRLLHETGWTVRLVRYRVPTTTYAWLQSLVYILETWGRHRPLPVLRRLLLNTVTTVVAWPLSALICLAKMGDGLEVYAVKQ